VTTIRRLIESVIPRGAILLSVLTFGGYVMGLVRDRVFARAFGASAELDAYNAALVLPELTLNILVIAGLVAAFVPVYTRTRQHDPDGAETFSRTVLTFSIAIMAVALVVLFIVAPATVQVVAPGFSPEQAELYTNLFRIMCVTSLIFAASFALGEMLVVRQRFLAYGLAPLLYNTGIVLGTLVLSPSMGIYGAAIGTVIGALLHLGIRLFDILRIGVHLRFQLELRSLAFRDYFRLTIPKMLSQPIEPLTFLYFTRVASTLTEGSVSAVSFARNFQSVPVSLIGVAFSVAAFPILAAAAAAGDRARFSHQVITNILTITVLTTAAAITLYVLSSFVIDLFLGGEAFDAQDVATTSLVLGAFTLSIPLESLTHLLARAIYSTRNTILPVIASIVGLVVTVVVVELLLGSQGIVALPLGFAAGQGAKVAVLAVALVVRTRTIRPESVPPPSPSAPAVDPG
jgi:putative peptidoglycan lipid II flippase